MQLTIDGVTHTITTGYDSSSRINAVTYPSGFAVAYAYNATGYQAQLSNKQHRRAGLLDRQCARVYY